MHPLLEEIQNLCMCQRAMHIGSDYTKQGFAEVSVDVVNYFRKQLVLAVKVEVNKAVADIGFLRNLLDGERMEGFLLEAAAGGIKNLLAALSADFILFQINTSQEYIAKAL